MTRKVDLTARYLAIFAQVMLVVHQHIGDSTVKIFLEKAHQMFSIYQSSLTEEYAAIKSNAAVSILKSSDPSCHELFRSSACSERTGAVPSVIRY